MSQVFLIGVKVWTCAYCREESAVIPKIGQLSDVLAHALLEKSAPLTGEELRYLRKHAGFAAHEFAALLRIDPAYLSRVECRKVKHLSGIGETLARLLIRAALVSEETAHTLLAFAQGLTQRPPAPAQPAFQWVRNHWRVAA